MSPHHTRITLWNFTMYCPPLQWNGISAPAHTHTEALFTPGINMRLGWFNKKWTVLKAAVHFCGHGFAQYGYRHAHWCVPRTLLFVLLWTSWACVHYDLIELSECEIRVESGSSSSSHLALERASSDHLWLDLTSLLYVHTYTHHFRLQRQQGGIKLKSFS